MAINNWYWYCCKSIPDEYVDFDTVKKWDDAYSFSIALVIFIAIIQLYQPMDFSRQLNSIKVTLTFTLIKDLHLHRPTILP